MSFFKKLLFILVIAFWGGVFAGINFYAPSYEALYIKGLEVKLMDQDGVITKGNKANSSIQDVYFIYTEIPGSNTVKVFRNENTRWGFPFYFKFDSAELQAKAASLQSVEEKLLVQVKSYGWQINMLEKFPNIISIKAIANENELSRPWLSYILYVLAFIGFMLMFQMVRGLFANSSPNSSANKK